MNFGARALIRLGALEHNLKALRLAAPEARIMAVVKANAYGHGMMTVARRLDDVDAFAVARSREALVLRQNGIDTKVILLSGVMDSNEVAVADRLGFEPVVHNWSQVEVLDGYQVGRVNVWAKFDTGMNRLGFDPGDAENVLGRLRLSPGVDQVRLMTHFASADDIGAPATKEQLEAFAPVATGFDGDVSIGNSPATLGWPETVDIKKRFGIGGDTWIRPGLALYGISPFADRCGADLGLMPVMQFEARLIAVKPLKAGARVGYQGTYVSDVDTTLGIIAAGYGDGYSRRFRNGTPVMLNGRRVSLIGNVSMDMIAVDLGANAKDQVGAIATLWGDDLPVEELASWADTIPYELVCGVTNREESEVSE